MATETMTADVLEILRHVLGLPHGVLRLDTELETHGWDSVAILETVAAVESMFGVELNLRTLRRIHTPGDLHQALATVA